MKNIKNWDNFLTNYKKEYKSEVPKIIINNIESILSDLQNGNISLYSSDKNEYFRLNYKIKKSENVEGNHYYLVNIDIQSQNNHKKNVELDFHLYDDSCELIDYTFYEEIKTLKKNNQLNKKKDNVNKLIQQDNEINFGF